MRYERVLEEPKISCARCGAELILSRMPWQSRCNKCTQVWLAKDIYEYHTQVVSLVERLPWSHHLRVRFSVEAHDVRFPQRQEPQWGLGKGAQSSFPPTAAERAAQKGAQKGASEAFQPFAQPPGPPQEPDADESSESSTKQIPSDRVSDILPDAVEHLSKAQFCFRNYLSGRSDSGWVQVELKNTKEYLSILRGLKTEVEQTIAEHQEALSRLQAQEELLSYVEENLGPVEEKLAQEKAQQGEASASSSSTPPQGDRAQGFLQMLKTSNLSPEEKAEIMKALSEEPKMQHQ